MRFNLFKRISNIFKFNFYVISVLCAGCRTLAFRPGVMLIICRIWTDLDNCTLCLGRLCIIQCGAFMFSARFPVCARLLYSDEEKPPIRKTAAYTRSTFGSRFQCAFGTILGCDKRCKSRQIQM